MDYPAPAAPATDSPARRAWRQFTKHKLAVAGLITIIIIQGLILAAPWLAKHDPNRIGVAMPFSAPSADNWLGTDQLGRDVFARLLYGGRVSFTVGFVSVGIYLIIGVTLGALSGYLGGWFDMAVQRITETVMTLPTILIVVTVVSLVGPSVYNIFLAIGLLGWPGVCRIVRSEFLSLRERDFVTAAKASGASTGRIVFRHILPNALGPVIVAGTLGIAGAILLETSLSFLGLGVQPPTPSWGNMLMEASRVSVLEGMPWLWLPPGIAISLSVLSFNFVGDGLRDALSPRTMR